MSTEGLGRRVDFDFLDRLAAGDQALMREVLEIFVAESRRWRQVLERGFSPEFSDTVHTLKGAGRAVGAHSLGDLCEDWETGELEDTEAIITELDLVGIEIQAWLDR